MEHGLVWLQDGEYERSHACHEKLRNDYEDVLNPLSAHVERFESFFPKGGVMMSDEPR